MTWDAPEFLEAIRLIRKFFPESQQFISEETGLDWDAFGGAMMAADYHSDYSGYPFRAPDSPDLGLASKGGLSGDDAEIYLRLLEHAGFAPTGRTVVVPDAFGVGSSVEECLPFVCHSRTVAARLRETPSFSLGMRDTLFVFESGEALLIDHDERVHWSKSQMRKWSE
jgi:hypothetical protein